MQKNLTLNILTATKRIYNGQIEKLFIESVSGKIEILPNHMDLVSVLSPSITRFVDMDGNEKTLFTSEGIMRITSGEIFLTCNSAEWPEEIDKNRAEAAKERAQIRLKEKDTNIDTQRAELSLHKAMLRLLVTK